MSEYLTSHGTKPVFTAISVRGFACKPKGEAAKQALFCMGQSNAASRNLKWTLTKEAFLRITGMPCHYCGVLWSSDYPNRNGKGKTNGTYKHNGIDRLDSTKGYIENNCVPCCKLCNVAKHRQTTKEFTAWIKQAYEHFILKGEYAEA